MEHPPLLHWFVVTLWQCCIATYSVPIHNIEPFSTTYNHSHTASSAVWASSFACCPRNPSQAYHPKPCVWDPITNHLGTGPGSLNLS